MHLNNVFELTKDWVAIRTELKSAVSKKFSNQSTHVVQAWFVFSSAIFFDGIFWYWIESSGGKWGSDFGLLKTEGKICHTTLDYNERGAFILRCGPRPLPSVADAAGSSFCVKTKKMAPPPSACWLMTPWTDGGSCSSPVRAACPTGTSGTLSSPKWQKNQLKRIWRRRMIGTY